MYYHLSVTSKVIAPTSTESGKVEIIYSSTGIGEGGGVTSYNDLIDKPTIPTQYTDAMAVAAVDISGKVDKVTGYGLSEEDFTTEEKSKLAGLDSNHFKGGYTTLSALTSAHPTGIAGDTATVDLGVGSDVVTYIWDVNDSKWVQEKGLGTTETAASIKTKYESNADTNAFTNTLKAKLDSITAIFTTTLKTAYDSASSWIVTNGANVLAHLTRTDNPHAVTKTQVNLGNVDNTSDINKPVSTAQATADTASKARANHTGTQLASTISDFNTSVNALIPSSSTLLHTTGNESKQGRLTLLDSPLIGNVTDGVIINPTGFQKIVNGANCVATLPNQSGFIALTSDLVGSSLQRRCCQIVTGRNAISVGADKGSTFIPSEVNNSVLTKVECYLKTAGTTTTTINIRKNGSNYVLSTAITIPANATRSTGSTPIYVIDPTYSLGITDDDFSVEILTAGTNAAGLTVTLTFTKQ